jgi:hypothetical protein
MNVQTDLTMYDFLDRKRYYMQVACLYRHVEDTIGVTPSQVHSFGFDPNWLESAEKLASDFPRVEGLCHNYVRLEGTNEVRPFPSFPAPQLPDSMKVGIVEIEE